MEEDGNANIKKFMPLIIAGFVACAIGVVGFSFIDMVSNKSGGKAPGGITNNVSAAMQQATDQARRNWPEFVQAFRNARPGDAFLVKSAFSEGGPVEHMWVNVTGMDERSVSGTLDSNPQILRQVKAGAPLRLGLQEIEDWTYISGGQRHGYFSYAAAMAEQQAATGQTQQGDGSSDDQGASGQGQGGQGGQSGQSGGLNGLLQNFLGGGENSGAGQGAQSMSGQAGQGQQQDQSVDDSYASRQQEQQEQEQLEQDQAREQEQRAQEAEEQARQESEQER